MLIERGMWQKRLVERTGEVVSFDSFEEFVTTPPLEGLGADIKTLRNLCRDDNTAKDALDRITIGTPGPPKGNQNARKTNRDNVTHCLPSEYVDPDRENSNPSEYVDPDRGNSNAYALRKLRKDRPEFVG